jgi:hypothetical protein
MRDKRPANNKDIIDTFVIGSRTFTSIDFDSLPGFGALPCFGGFGGLERFGGFGGFGFLFLVTCYPSLYSFDFCDVSS